MPQTATSNRGILPRGRPVDLVANSNTRAGIADVCRLDATVIDAGTTLSNSKVGRNHAGLNVDQKINRLALCAPR